MAAASAASSSPSTPSSFSVTLRALSKVLLAPASRPLLLACAASLALIATLRARRAARRRRCTQLSASDAEHVAAALLLLRRSPRPIHSNFLVAAVVAYEDAQGTLRHEVGVNSETCCLTSAICAERSALLQTRLRPHGCRRLLAVYVTATSEHLITPGMLCREFMMEFPHAEDTRIVLFTPAFRPFADAESSGGGSRGSRGTGTLHGVFLELRLSDLFPLPHLYHRVPRERLVRRGLELAQRAQLFDAARAAEAVRLRSRRALPAARLQLLYEGVVRLAQAEEPPSSADSLYPIHRAAGVIFADGSVELAREDKALEYGCSADCVVKLYAAMQAGRARGADPVLLLCVDQFGLLAAPTAPPRSWLAEHLSVSGGPGERAAAGDSDLGATAGSRLSIAVHDRAGVLHFVSVADLCPAAFAPAITLSSEAAAVSGPPVSTLPVAPCALAAAAPPPPQGTRSAGAPASGMHAYVQARQAAVATVTSPKLASAT